MQVFPCGKWCVGQVPDEPDKACMRSTCTHCISSCTQCAACKCVLAPLHKCTAQARMPYSYRQEFMKQKAQMQPEQPAHTCAEYLGSDISADLGGQLRKDLGGPHNQSMLGQPCHTSLHCRHNVLTNGSVHHQETVLQQHCRLKCIKVLAVARIKPVLQAKHLDQQSHAQKRQSQQYPRQGAL